jgi:hypothetical protein
LYQAQGTAVSGQYANIATATAVDAFENPVQDTDPSHYFGLAHLHASPRHFSQK